MAKKEVTKAPTGLGIVRSENSFTASWKIGDKDYADGQYFQYAIDTTGKVSWLPTKNTGIGVKTTSKVITTINKSNYYPNIDSEGNNKPFLYNICFRVKGNRKKYTARSGRKKKTHNPSASAWTSKGFVVNPPKKPTLTYALDGELTNVCTFSWSAPYESNDSYIFTDVQWQTILVKNSSEADGSKLDWGNAEEGTGGAEGSKTITEDTSILYKNGNSYTRWFRVRSRGPRGVHTADGSNGWVYEKHVYALSHQADVTGTSASETEEGGFQCTVDWTAGQSGGQNPIDKTIAQYTITTPDVGLTCPSGASWKDANISRDTEAGDAAVFGIDDQLGKDQCLFIRVNTQHDSNLTYGKPQLSYVGFLKDPSGLSVSTDNVTHKATITATNNSAVEDSILIVRYVPSSGDPIDVGVIPHGSTSVTVQCPNWDDQKAIAFEVYAIVGTAVKQTRADGVDSYSVSVGMRSQNTVSKGGAVPVAPKNVSVSRVEGKSDTVRVDWDWPWSEAGSAEISWSDHDDAWESTDAPESFLISNLHASHWNISGLETGKTWYVRVRLIAGNMATSDGVTYGPWSDISQGTIDLSSAPNKPVLILSNSVIPEDGSTIASWVYTTTDNTAQAYAEVAIVENGEYIPIAHSLTAQHVTIPAQSENYTLSTGNIYNLVCRVKSASGKLSEWSDIVSLTVAEPISCEIVQTSLVHDHIELNPREFGPDNLLTFETELEENFAKVQVNLEPIQDFNGYSYPWVGGAGKNKLKITANTSTVNGITFTVNGDGSVTVNGTSTANNTFFNLKYNAGVLNLPVDTPIILAMKEDKPTSAIMMQAIGTGSPAVLRSFSTSESFAVSPAFTIDSSRGDTTTWVRLQIDSSGTTIDNVTVYPMWSLASDAPTEWEPYENICPISGQDKASASVVGKNLFDIEDALNYWGIEYTKSDGKYVCTNGSGGYSKPYVFSDGDIDVCLRGIVENITATNVRVQLLNSQGSVVREILAGDEVANVATANRVRLNWSTNGSFALRNMQIEKGSTATPYEPYQKQTTSVDFNATLTPTSTDTTPYLFKAVGDIYGDRLEDKIVGGTVAWNQMAETGDYNYSSNGITVTRTAGTGITNIVVSDNVTGFAQYAVSPTKALDGHKYALIVDKPLANGMEFYITYVTESVRGEFPAPRNQATIVNAVSESTDCYMYIGATTPAGTYEYNVQVFDLTQMFGSTIADYIYSLEQATAGAGVAWFKKLFPNDYYAYNAGELLSVEGLQSHDAVGFNQWDEEWEVGGLIWATGQPAELSDRWRSKNFQKCFPNTNYYGNKVCAIFFYDAEQNFISYSQFSVQGGVITTPTNCRYFKLTSTLSATYNHDICINLSNPSRNGEYKPYEKHSYPLDSSLTLRGIPKLDASNNLYYDGDEYTSDGKVKRKYGIVDLGTLSWARYSFNGNYVFYANVTGRKSRSLLSIQARYARSVAPSPDAMIDKTFADAFNASYVYIKDDSYTDVATFKSAMSGVMLVYELATPTTETAQAYTNPQIVSKYGTLEYVTNSIVPVGHSTTYLTRDIFGGYVDLISGKLVVTHSLATFTGTGNWGLETTADGRISYYQNLATANKMTDRKKGTLYGELTSNMLVGTQSAIVGQVYVSSGGYLNCRPGFGTTAADWKSFLASNNLQIMYPLATPQTYQLTPQQVNTLVGTNNVWSDSGQVEVRIAESMRDVDTLTKMPLSIKVTGAGDGGITTVVVERAEDYLMVRPDETNFNGNKGEMVLQTSPPLVGINQVSFSTDDLIGPMDDGAVYNIVATVQDGLGQKDSVTLPFEVHWEHQAKEPSAEILVDEENLIAYIKPIAPANADPEDVADIYRLSADKPELIVEGAIFGETYVDPYPALGDMGGHRIVTRTKNGDYITEGNQIAMIDSPELGVNPIENEDLLNVIDFEGRQIRFYWETDYSNTWAKDFQETAYLGGSIEGDWNPAVSRSGTLSSKAITVLDQEMLKDVRRLADYPGICHVRTADGSSYAADVQVSEDYTDDEKGMVTNYSLSITKVGSQGFDGMTKEQWDDENPVEVEEGI